MEEKITIDLVLSVFKSYTDSKKLKDIKSAVVAMFTPEGQLMCNNQAQIEKEVEDVIKEDRKLDKESFLIYSGGNYRKRKGKKAPVEDDSPIMSAEYIGRAGECAVMSELMFRGYNANRMMIDEGIDIVAVKNNMYYYVQVKTVSVKNGKVYCQIGMERFDQYIGAQIRYIIVARYKDKGTSKNMFFTFTSQEIDKYIYDRSVKRGENSISIKIAFNERTGEPYLYDDRETNIAWNMNRFDL